MEERIIRTDVAIEVLAEYYTETKLNKIYQKKRKILKMQQLGNEYVIFDRDIDSRDDIIEARIKGFTE